MAGPAFSAHKEAIKRLMETLDDNAQGIGSGPYASMAKDLQHLYALEEHRSESSLSAFGLTMACEHPMGINSTKLIGLLKNEAWLRKVVISKKLEHEHLLAQGQPRLATIITRQWMRAFAEAAIDKHSLLVGSGLCKIRWGIRALFVMRVGMLPYVVETLNSLHLKPQELFALSFGTEPPEDDPGLGPTASQLLALEPRFIRWLLGVDEDHRWPTGTDYDRYSAHENALLGYAERVGGDDASINNPCSCATCGHTNFRFMPRTTIQQAHEHVVHVDYGTLDWFPPTLTSLFDEPERCDMLTWFERRLMRDRCNNPNNTSKPRWYLSAKAREFFKLKGLDCSYTELGLRPWYRAVGPAAMLGNPAYDAEFMQVLAEAQEAGYAESVGDRVRTLSRACKRQRSDARDAP